MQIKTQPQNIWAAHELREGIEDEIEAAAVNLPKEYYTVLRQSAWLDILQAAWPAGNC